MGVVPPEPVHKGFLTLAGLRAAARQTPGLQRIPQDLQNAISAFLAEQSVQDVKTSVARLATAMRDHKLNGRVKQLDAKELKTSILAQQAAAEFEEDKVVKRRWQPSLERSPIKYETQQTVAYVAARLPSVYAAVHRVLSEVSRRVPDFKPCTLMDYGSGPGTVLWAAGEIWPTSVKHVNFVEPSPAMAHACRSMLKDQEGLPTVQTYSSLQAFSERRGRHNKSRLHDIVVASYSLGELSSMAERISTVRQLWGLTQDILVLIEPGTPEGFQVIQEMRKHVLQMERKKVRKQQQRNRNEVTPKDGDNAAAAAEGKMETGGAFVVAPCAHDGSCPMENTGKWCHFAQRVERTQSQRMSKRLPGSGPALRGYEDEKFSFVVLRHGLRPRAPWPMKLVTDESMRANRRAEVLQEDNLVLPRDFEHKDGQPQEDSGWISDAEGDKEEACDMETHNALVDGEQDSDVEQLSPDSSWSLGRSQEEWEDEGEVVHPLKTVGDGLVDLDRECEGDGGGDEWHEEDAEAADLGGGWARIVQPPMKRGGHVYLDLCSSVGSDVSEGKLQRLVAVRSGIRALYLHARKSRWGDLWPC